MSDISDGNLSDENSSTVPETPDVSSGPVSDVNLGSSPINPPSRKVGYNLKKFGTIDPPDFSNVPSTSQPTTPNHETSSPEAAAADASVTPVTSNPSGSRGPPRKVHKQLSLIIFT